tara:strand:- start:130 stop:291 length:162 start_codon:yes stop_codon:yes gene_type:complete
MAKESSMKIGDLVKNRYGEHGIIIRQIGIADRWWIEWLVGPPYAINGCNLEVV